MGIRLHGSPVRRPSRHRIRSYHRNARRQATLLSHQVAHPDEQALNEYEKAFFERMSRLDVDGPDFARLTREALEAEFGGEGDAILKGLGPETLEDPKRFASEMYKTYGRGALQYFTMIVKYVGSGRFNPDEEAEEEAEEEDLESIIDEVESSSVGESGSGPGRPPDSYPGTTSEAERV